MKNGGHEHDEEKVTFLFFLRSCRWDSTEQSLDLERFFFARKWVGLGIADGNVAKAIMVSACHGCWHWIRNMHKLGFPKTEESFVWQLPWLLKNYSTVDIIHVHVNMNIGLNMSTPAPKSLVVIYFNGGKLSSNCHVYHVACVYM